LRIHGLRSADHGAACRAEGAQETTAEGAQETTAEGAQETTAGVRQAIKPSLVR